MGHRPAWDLPTRGAILDFLSATFGPHPFATSCGIVDEDPDLGFALENQTRPIYSTAASPASAPAGSESLLLRWKGVLAAR